MENRTELQSHITYLLYRMLGDKVNYNELKTVINGCEDIQDSVDDQIGLLFAKYLEKYGPIQ